MGGVTYAGDTMDQAYTVHKFTRPGHTILSEPVIQEICHSVSTFFETEVPFDQSIPNVTVEQMPLPPASVPFKLFRVYPPNLAQRGWVNPEATNSSAAL